MIDEGFDFSKFNPDKAYFVLAVIERISPEGDPALSAIHISHDQAGCL